MGWTDRALERTLGFWGAVGKAQDAGEQASRDCDLSRLEGDLATVARDLGTDLDQLLPRSDR